MSFSPERADHTGQRCVRVAADGRRCGCTAARLAQLAAELHRADRAVPAGRLCLQRGPGGGAEVGRPRLLRARLPGRATPALHGQRAAGQRAGLPGE